MPSCKRILVVIAILLIASAALFAGNKPLLLDSSDPADGATGVSAAAEPLLVFSKNVVNFSIADANKGCFSLESAAGEEVEIEVVMADDQMHPEQKRNIRIVPAEELAPDTEYLLTISGDLQAKNGNTLGEDLVIRFTTGS